MPRHDVFFVRNPETIEHRRHAATTNADATMALGGFDVTFGSGPSLAFVEGELVSITGGTGSKIAFCWITKVTSATQITLLPVQSTTDTAAEGHVFTSGASVSTVSVPMPAATLIVDLSEAAPGSYDYVVIATAGIMQAALNNVSIASLRVTAFDDDPRSGTGALGQATVTHGSTSDVYPFVASRRVSLTAGQRYAFYLQITCNTANGSAFMRNASILALRCTSPAVVDAANNGAANTQTNTTGTLATAATLGANIPAGRYLVVATWCGGMSTLAAEFEAQLELDGSTNLATQIMVPKATGDRVPAGFSSVVDVPATNEIRLRFRRTSSGTATVDFAQLCAIPIPAWVDDSELSADLTVHTGSVSVPSSFSVASGSVTLESGWHIEIASAGFGADGGLISAGAIFAGGAFGGPSMVVELDATTGRHLPTFGFVRNERAAGATQNSVYMLGNITTARIANAYFSWLRERAIPTPKEDDAVEIYAEIENGALCLKHWNATAVSGRYWHHLDGVDLLSRVKVNATDYTRITTALAESDLLATGGTLDDGEWYWDAANGNVYVELPSGDTPADADIQVFVIPELRVSGRGGDLRDDSGEWYPYEPRLENTPGMTQELDSDDGRFSVATTYGSAKLSSADGSLNDPLVQRYFPGIRAKLWRGYPGLSDRAEDRELIGDVVIDEPDTDFEEITLKLFDRGVALRQPVATTKITVSEGNSEQSNARTRSDQLLPVVWGKVLGLIAYRVTAVYTADAYEEFQFAPHGVSDVVAVYRDAERLHPIDLGTYIDKTNTYLNAGKIRVKNNTGTGVSDANQPFDVVYVDVVGRTSDGTSSGTALKSRGVQARDLLVTYGGLAGKDLIESTFRSLDRRWRKQRTGPPYTTIVPKPPELGFVTEADESVWDAYHRMLGDCGAYPLVNRQGRVGCRVPDFDAVNLLIEGGFEAGSASSCWPWFKSGTASFATTTSRKFDGARSAEIGASAGTDYVGQFVATTREGSVVVTLLAALVSGDSMHFRIGVVTPDGVEQLSDDFEIQSQRWTRCTFAADVPIGAAGTCLLKLYPAYGSGTATVVAVDEAWLVQVPFIADDTSSLARGLRFREDVFYEARVAYGVNLQDSEHVSKFVLRDGEARGIGTSLSEGQFAVASSGSVDLGMPLCADVGSAAAIAAAIVLRFGRTVHVLPIDLFDVPRIPLVGDPIYVRNLVVDDGFGEDQDGNLTVPLRKHVPDTADGFPIWLASSVSYEDENGHVVSAELERQQDPVADRIEISPDAFPVGTGCWSLSSNAMTDFAEQTSMADFFARCHRVPDLATARGNFVHQHDLDHVHAIASHEHTTSVTSHGAEAAGDPTYQWARGADDYPEYPGFFGPNTRFDGARRTHPHTLPGTSKKVAAAGGTSGGATAALLSKPGGNIPAHRRVRWMLRTANSGGVGITADTVIGWLTTDIPTLWTRVTGLDDYYLRGASSRGSVSTTVATSSYVPSDAGSTLTVASTTNIAVGKRLVVTSGGSHMAVIVTAVSGTDLTVTPIYEVGDTVTTYAVGSTITGDSDVVNQTYTPANHDHGAALPSHAHDGSHAHGQHATESHQLGAVTGGQVDRQISVTSFGPSQVIGDHAHIAKPTAPSVATTSGSAAGTITGAAVPAPDAYALVFITPADPMNLPSALPAGCVLWTGQQAVQPGYSERTDARGKLIKGAAAGQGGGAMVGGHVHQMTPAAHTLSHAHGGSSSVLSEDASGAQAAPDFANGIQDRSASAAPEAGTSGRKGHAHLTAYSISTVDPGLTAAATQDTGAVAGAASMPRNKRVKLVEKG